MDDLVGRTFGEVAGPSAGRDPEIGRAHPDQALGEDRAAAVGDLHCVSGVELSLPGLFGRGGPLGGLSGGFKTPLDVQFHLSPLLFSGSHVMVLLVVPVVLLALTLFLRRSPVGVAIRAASANAERAMLLGIPVMVGWFWPKGRPSPLHHEQPGATADGPPPVTKAAA